MESVWGGVMMEGVQWKGSWFDWVRRVVWCARLHAFQHNRAVGHHEALSSCENRGGALRMCPCMLCSCLYEKEHGLACGEPERAGGCQLGSFSWIASAGGTVQDKLLGACLLNAQCTHPS